MFRKAFALAATALCASAASATNLRVTNLASHVSTTQPTTPYTNVVTLKAQTVLDLQSADNTYSYLVVQCPAAKAVRAKANAKFSGEKAFLSYVTISTGDGDSELEVIDGKTGNVLGLLYAQASEGYGSQLTLICVNGRATAAFNYEY